MNPRLFRVTTPFACGALILNLNTDNVWEVVETCPIYRKWFHGVLESTVIQVCKRRNWVLEEIVVEEV